MTRLSGFTCVLLVMPAFAQEWTLRDADHLLSRTEVEALVSGRTITFYDDGRSNYAADGAYWYIYASGAAAYGRYEIREDGTVCVQFRNGLARCDKYVRSGIRFVLMTQKGLRFPVNQPKNDDPAKLPLPCRVMSRKTNLNECFETRIRVNV